MWISHIFIKICKLGQERSLEYMMANVNKMALCPLETYWNKKSTGWILSSGKN